MSFDIYGNPLARGHCEVHPYVAEEYPCSVCIMDSKQARERGESEQASIDAFVAGYLAASDDAGVEVSPQALTKYAIEKYKNS